MTKSRGATRRGRQTRRPELLVAPWACAVVLTAESSAQGMATGVAAQGKKATPEESQRKQLDESDRTNLGEGTDSEHSQQPNATKKRTVECRMLPHALDEAHQAF